MLERDQSPTLDYMILSPAFYHSAWDAMASPYSFETWIIDRKALSDFSLAIVRAIVVSPACSHSILLRDFSCCN